MYVCINILISLKTCWTVIRIRTQEKKKSKKRKTIEISDTNQDADDHDDPDQDQGADDLLAGAGNQFFVHQQAIMLAIAKKGYCHNRQPSSTLNQHWHHHALAGPFRKLRPNTLTRRLYCLLPGDRLNGLLQTLARVLMRFCRCYSLR